jgi:hypothetical protein
MYSFDGGGVQIIHLNILEGLGKPMWDCYNMEA